MRIACPHCGLRDLSEFAYFGDASRVRPPLGDSDLEGWNAYVHERGNPKGLHQEFWQHQQGCRQWLLVERDTATHEMLGVRMARAIAAMRLAGGHL